MDIAELKAASEPLDDGQWVGDDVHGLPGVRLRVRSLNAPVVARALGRKMRSASDDMRDLDGGLTDEAQDQIDDEVMAKLVLCDWEGLTSDGEAVPFSHDLASELLKSGIFWTAARSAAQHVSLVSRQAMEALAKN